MQVKTLVLSAVLVLYLLPACSDQTQDSLPVAVEFLAPKHFTLADFYSNNDTLAKKVDSLYKGMDIGERAAQLIMPATGVSKKYGLPFATIVQLYQSKKIGGLLFLKGTRPLFTGEIKKLNALADSTGLFPLVYSCDCEPALFHHKFTDADSMAPASLLKTNEAVAASANAVAAEMKKMGIQWNLAPVVDLGSNQAIINNRSFGNSPPDVIAKSVSFIKASAQNNIATAIKHFPGHGAITGDTHRELLYIDASLTEVNNFQAVIYQAAPISVMTGHIAIQNNPVYQTGGLPASLSEKIVTNLLKKDLGFMGIVVTDAMNMGALRNIPDADYRAILAGNDMVVMPQNVTKLHGQLVSLLRLNNGQGKSLEQSVKKLLRLKFCLGIIH
jgi:beta-N-acetylhexosaminidase